MANNFSESRFKALWRFEAGALTTDSKGGNTLTPSGSPSADTGDYKEGGASALFDVTFERFYITDANLDSGFPFKEGDTNRNMSVCGWFYLDSQPNSYSTIFQKVNQITLWAYYNGSNIVFRLGTSDTGIGWTDYKTGSIALQTGRWYHFGLTYNGSDGSFRIRCWDDTAQQLIGSDQTGTADIVVDSDGLVSISYDSGGFVLLGNVDEYVICDEILTTDEIDQIRQGTYPVSTTTTPEPTNDFSTDPNCVAHYRLEDGADFIKDSIGGNDLTNGGGVIANTSDKAEGVSSADTYTNDATAFLYRDDDDLDSGFPGKSGETNRTFSVCFRVKFESFRAGSYQSIISKWNTTDQKKSWGLFTHDLGSADYRVGLYIGYNNGIFTEGHDHGSGLSAGIWYFIAVTYNSSDKSYRIRILNDDTGDVIGSDLTGIGTNVMNIENARFHVSGQEDVNADNHVKALLDDVVIFDDVLSVTEIDQIWEMIYSGPVTSTTTPGPTTTTPGPTSTSSSSTTTPGPTSTSSSSTTTPAPTTTTPHSTGDYLEDLIKFNTGDVWLWLCEIAVPTQDTQTIARNTENVTYNETEYDKGNFEFSGQEFCGDGSIPRVTLRVSNLQNDIEEIVNATQGALNGEVKLLKVNNNYLDEPVPALEADYDVLCAESDEKWTTFTLGVPNPMTQRFPLYTESSSMCRSATPTLFKGIWCQYDGEDTTCPGDYLHCLEVKNNAEHWNGEKGLDPNAV